MQRVPKWRWSKSCTTRARPPWLPIAAARTDLEVQPNRDIAVHQPDDRQRRRPRLRLVGAPGAETRREAEVVSDLPTQLPAMREEIAIWRAFLSEEIDAILREGQ